MFVGKVMKFEKGDLVIDAPFNGRMTNTAGAWGIGLVIDGTDEYGLVEVLWSEHGIMTMAQNEILPLMLERCLK